MSEASTKDRMSFVEVTSGYLHFVGCRPNHHAIYFNSCSAWIAGDLQGVRIGRSGRQEQNTSGEQQEARVDAFHKNVLCGELNSVFGLVSPH